MIDIAVKVFSPHCSRIQIFSKTLATAPKVLAVVPYLHIDTYTQADTYIHVYACVLDSLINFDEPVNY